MSLYELGNNDEAIIAYSNAIKHEQDATKDYPAGAKKETLSFYLNNKGLALFNLEQPDGAMSDYEEAILNNPDDAEIYFNIGNVHLSRQKFELAHELFNKAIEILPSKRSHFLRPSKIQTI